MLCKHGHKLNQFLFTLYSVKKVKRRTSKKANQPVSRSQAVYVLCCLLLCSFDKKSVGNLIRLCSFCFQFYLTSVRKLKHKLHIYAVNGSTVYPCGRYSMTLRYFVYPSKIIIIKNATKNV